MAQRRMFSPDIVASDAFLDMPISSQALYFHLGMGADDDGFVNPKRIMRIIGAGDDDLTVLLVKRFLLKFENGVVVIKHWLIHNMIRKDRYKETRYLDEKKQLKVKDNGAYTDVWQPNGNQPAPQVRLGKVSRDVGEIQKSPDPPPSRNDPDPPKIAAKSPPMKIYAESDDVPTIQEGDPTPSPKGKNNRVDDEAFIAYYTTQYLKRISPKIPFVNKAIVYKNISAPLKHYGLPRLKELLDSYFKSDDKWYKEEKWGILTFLSMRTLNKLE